MNDGGMRRAIRMILALAGLAVATPAGAEILVGVAAPLSGPSAALGAQVRDGARVAAALLPEPKVKLEIADDKCTAEGGAAAANQFVTAKVGMAIGFLCTEAIEAALPILKAANIPVVTVGARANGLTDRKQKTGWLVYRLGPRADSEAQAVAALLTRAWANDPFAIVDDGTIYGRELAEGLRLASEQAGLKPVYVDNYRPHLDNQTMLVDRLTGAGATKAFLGGDRDDIAVTARDAAARGANLQLAGGETLLAPDADVPLAAGTLMVGLPDWSADLDETVASAFKRAGSQPWGYALPAYAAVQVARQALSGEATTSLSGSDFTTIVGRIRFDEKGDLAENPFRLFRYDGARFVPLDVP